MAVIKYNRALACQLKSECALCDENVHVHLTSKGLWELCGNGQPQLFSKINTYPTSTLSLLFPHRGVGEGGGWDILDKNKYSEKNNR